MNRLLDAVRPTNRLDSEVVDRAYHLLFDRDPESADVVNHHIGQHADIWSLLASLMQSPEFQGGAARHHEVRTTLDWRPLLERFRQPHPSYRRGYITNFLDVPTKVSFLRHLKGAPGHVEGLPIPGDFTSSTAEWIAGLRGVELAGDNFVAVELGAGWGVWMVNLCRAARIKGAKKTFAIGCEVDELHCEFVFEHLASNGFVPENYQVFQGAIGPRKGISLFPVSRDSSDDWGMRPIFCESDQKADAIIARPQDHADYRGVTFRKFRRVPCYTLAEVLARVDHVDVLHIDIQGGEAELLRHNLDLVKRMVRYLVIGTHSRQIEGELIALLAEAGWKLEVEEPCAFDIGHPTLAVRIDGTQGWRNPGVDSKNSGL